jgi:structure-specific recognition protein 1
MSTETFTLTSAAQLKDYKSFMTKRYGKFKKAIDEMDEADELDEDTIYQMIENYFLNYEENYKVSKTKKSTKGESKSRKSKTVKDDNMPKRAQSAYMLWLNDNRKKIKTEHFTDDDGNLTLEGRDKVTQVAKKAGELWKTVSDEDKSPYKAKAEELKEQYKRDMQAYESSSSPTPQDETDGEPEKSVKKTTKKAESNKESTKKKNSKKTGTNEASSNGKASYKKVSANPGKGKAKAKAVSNSEEEFKSTQPSDNEEDETPASKSVKFEKHVSESESSESDSESELESNTN